jgi:hypothetical protein
MFDLANGKISFNEQAKKYAKLNLQKLKKYGFN